MKIACSPPWNFCRLTGPGKKRRLSAPEEKLDYQKLSFGYIGCLWSFGAFGQFKLHVVIFL
jgi:hypothetical protein